MLWYPSAFEALTARTNWRIWADRFPVKPLLPTITLLLPSLEPSAVVTELSIINTCVLLDSSVNVIVPASSMLSAANASPSACGSTVASEIDPAAVGSSSDSYLSVKV